MAYKYTASTTENRIIKGTIDVSSEGQAESALYQSGCEYIFSLKKISPVIDLETLVPSIFGIKSREVIDFAGQLATLTRSGVNIVSALQLIAGQTSSAPLRKVINGLAAEVEGGNSFSQALGRYPHVFPEVFTRVVMASEKAGSLDAGLKHAVVYMEAQEQAKQKIRRAMLYPAFILIMAGAVSLLLITLVLPPLTRLFNSFGAELPWMTRTLISFTNFILKYSWQLLVILVIIIVLFVGLFKLPSVKFAGDKFKLKLPFFKSLIIERSMQHFCQTTAMLLKAGIGLPQILEITAQANQNRVLYEAIEGVRDKLVQGEGFSQPLAGNRLFPPLLAEMAAVGEKSGALDETLEEMAEVFTKKVDRKINTVISMIEPVMTLVIGMAVLFLALSIITPLYSILHSIR